MGAVNPNGMRKKSFQKIIWEFLSEKIRNFNDQTLRKMGLLSLSIIHGNAMMAYPFWMHIIRLLFFRHCLSSYFAINPSPHASRLIDQKDQQIVSLPP